MNNLTKHFQLRPHGDRLLTSSASFWLFAVRVLILAMAGAESLAWSYLGFLFGDGWLRFGTAMFFGVTIFAVVWMVDVSLVTHDRAWNEHSLSILGQTSARRASKARQIASFTLRIALLLASLTITAPYLAQLVFQKDIDQLLVQEATSKIDVARTEMTRALDERVSVRQSEVDRQRRFYEQEVAGQGPSGRYGSGPAAQAMLRSLEALESDLKALQQARSSALTRFDSLTSDWRRNPTQLAALYNLQLPRTSILENNRALELLREQPQNRRTELAIKVFLAMIFASLLLLKLFEPSSVRLYLSDVLQQEYDRYLAGSFDAQLPPTEVSTAAGAAISPQRLHAFLVKIWAPARQLEESTATIRAQRVAAVESLKLLEAMREHAQTEAARARDELQEVDSAAQEATQSDSELTSAITAVKADIASLSADLLGLDGLPDRDDARLAFDLPSRLKLRTYLSRKLADAKRALRELEESLPVEAERLRRVQARLRAAEERVRHAEEELTQRQAEVREVRSALAKSSETRARSAFDLARAS